MTPHLDACKHCGARAEFDHDDEGYYWIWCTKCAICTETMRHAETDALIALAVKWNAKAPALYEPIGCISATALKEFIKTGNDSTYLYKLHDARSYCIPVYLAPQPAVIEKPFPLTGWCLVPKELTAANGAKKVLLGEFQESIEIDCIECWDCGRHAGCDCCHGTGKERLNVNVSWPTIKAIHKRVTSLFGNRQLEEIKAMTKK